MKSMKSLPALALCLVIMAVFLGSSALAAEAPKEAVLIVAFGTSIEKARVSYAKVEEEVKAAFPRREILWAWTANSLLKTAPKGAPMLSTQEALAKLATDGVKEVTILSLHIIPGSEYSDLAKNAAAFEGLPKGLTRVRLSPPLLNDTESVATVAKALLKSVPQARKADEAVLFVGHGTHHPAGVFYPALQYYLGELDKNAFVGTVEGDLDLEKITAALKAKAIKKVWVAPLMTVAGDHATNDLFGAEPDSWKQHFQAAGIQVEAIPKGLGENPDLIALWISGLKKAAEEKVH